MKSIFVLLLISFAVYSVNCYELVKNDRQTIRYPFPSTTPTCLAKDVPNRSDVALVYYPIGSPNTCADNGGQIKPNTIWFGFRFGVCHQNDICGLDCTCLANCGSKGYTIDEFNNCYKSSCGSCAPNTSYVRVVPDVDNQIIANFYTDSACLNPKPGNSSIDYFQLNKCDGTWFGCDYGSTTWSRLDCPDVSSGSSIEMFWNY